MTARNLKSASEVMIIAVSLEGGEVHMGYLKNFTVDETFTISAENAVGAYRPVEVVNHAVGTAWRAEEGAFFTKTLRERGIIIRDNRLPFGDSFIWRIYDKVSGTDLGVLVDSHTQAASTEINANQTILSRMNGLSIRFYDRSELG